MQSVKGPLKYLNDRFPFPFKYLKAGKGSPFRGSLPGEDIIGSNKVLPSPPRV